MKLQTKFIPQKSKRQTFSLSMLCILKSANKAATQSKQRHDKPEEKWCSSPHRTYKSLYFNPESILCIR